MDVPTFIKVAFPMSRKPFINPGQAQTWQGSQGILDYVVVLKERQR
jgi:hypothetical protein